MQKKLVNFRFTSARSFPIHIMAIKRGHIYIGTSNVVVPGNKTTFPPSFQSTSRLHYYSHLFNTVEINSSFYKTPLFSTYEKWTRDVPDDFRFSIKLSKEITHVKDLKNDLTLLDKFMQTAKGTGIKKGCLLIQFPGKITLDHFEKVEQILEELRQYDENNEWRKVVEFRNDSWYTGETWELLDEFKAAMVLHDIPKSKMMHVRGKAKFVYIRFHGPKGDYRDSYTDQFLKDRADEFKQWTKQGKDVYAYFNNTIGSAFENAMKLKRFLNR